MEYEKALKKLKETAIKQGAPFISTEYLETLLPKTATNIYFDEFCHIDEVLNHEIECLREFIELANDKLCAFTTGEQYRIGIISVNF